MTVTPICPGCRARQRLLLAVGCDFVLLAPEPPSLPEHMSNCPARAMKRYAFMVETWHPGPT